MTDSTLAVRALLPAFVVTLAATPLARRAAITVGAFDRPGPRKIHSQPTPYFGGLAILVGLAAGFVASGIVREIPHVVAGSLLLAAVGVADDLRSLPIWPRIVAQTTAAVFVVAGGIRPVISGTDAVDIAITLLWIVVITNAFNLLDNMDGLSSAAAGVAAAAFLAITWGQGQDATVALSAAVIGGVIGFLPYNYPRAKIFMGDAGSTVIGFLVAVLALAVEPPLPRAWDLALPVCVLALALVDTTLVVVDRTRSGRRLTWGGSDHMSHRLVSLGLTRRGAVAALVGVSTALGAASALASREVIASPLPLAGAALAGLAGLALLRVPVAHPPTPDGRTRTRQVRVIDLGAFDGPPAATPMRRSTNAALSPRHVFTVDVEEWFHGIELPRGQWPTESRLQVGMSRLLGLLDRHHVRATFFVLGAVAERHPRLVASLAATGHEIACHGFSHQLVYRQTREEFRDDVRRAVGAIVLATGEPPRGYRAPYFSVRRDSLWALEVLAEEGFIYDSSVFPVRNHRYGIPTALRRPHDVQTPVGLVREVPMTTVRVLGRNVPFSGGAYLRILPWWTQGLAWRAASRSEEPAILYVHPWELDPDHPRIDLPTRVAATHYARLRLTELRLDRLLGRYRFGRLDEVMAICQSGTQGRRAEPPG